MVLLKNCLTLSGSLTSLQSDKRITASHWKLIIGHSFQCFEDAANYKLDLF